ncbi:MAG: hypothetical protein GY769_16325 [bacterium]|nr:hypothetical protein [bacterium]
MARRLVLAGAVLVAAWLILDLWTDDARRIERRLARLQKLAGKTLVESQFQGAGKARAIADLFATEFELSAEPESYATASRQDLIRGVIAYRARSQSLAVDVLRKELFVDPGGQTATHYAYVRFVNDLGDFAGTASYPVQIEWVEEDGKWKIKKLEVLPEELPPSLP